MLKSFANFIEINSTNRMIVHAEDIITIYREYNIGPLFPHWL